MTTTRGALRVEHGELPLAIARGERGRAAVAIMPSAFGVAPDLQEQMIELARDARVVVTFDPFFRDDPGVAAYDDVVRVRARLAAYDFARGTRDLRAVVDWARVQPGVGAVVALGICFGGAYALLAAADGAVDGVVTWHGTWMEARLERAHEIRVPLRLQFGGADPFVSPAAIGSIRAAFATHADVRIVVHERATHGFTHRGAPAAYDAGAERAAMDAVRELVTGVIRRVDD